jgi:predicted RNase H-like HicB family nuclease
MTTDDNYTALMECNDSATQGDGMAEVVMAELKEHPIMLTLRDAISGNGYLAQVTVSGRALMRQEDDGKWWMYGVRPGGIAESGATIEEAFLRFRTSYTEVLFDIAEENQNFEDFRTEVERFFYECDEEDQCLWDNALSRIRKNDLAPPAPFSNLPRESPDSKPAQVTVERLDQANRRFLASDNVRDTYSVPMGLAA